MFGEFSSKLNIHLKNWFYKWFYKAIWDNIEWFPYYLCTFGGDQPLKGRYLIAKRQTDWSKLAGSKVSPELAMAKRTVSAEYLWGLMDASVSGHHQGPRTIGPLVLIGFF